jgi:hypothetical protein
MASSTTSLKRALIRKICSPHDVALAWTSPWLRVDAAIDRNDMIGKP